jgi:hypothetical protein|tara:strand:+ start:376 stop:624 length:249 start_codon:yes stop_codon:yes gene_type:complete
MNKINEVINDLKKEIRNQHNYNGRRWKIGYWNQPGVYEVKLNIAQIKIINESLKNIKYQEHLKKHWRDMYKEVIEDHIERGR